MTAKWSELMPYGRDLYYEGKNPTAFAKEMKEKYNLNVYTSGHYNRANGFRFYCPARLLDEIYDNRKYPLGS